MSLPGARRKARMGRRLAACCAVALAGAALMSLSGCRRVKFPRYPSDFREYAWVTNGGSNSVTVLDLLNMQQNGAIDVGANPTAIAVSPQRDEVYVVNSGSASVSVIDAKKNRVAATIAVRRQPASIDIDADGARAYVANAGSNSVSVIDLEKRREIATLGVGDGPADARISPDGNTLVVANRGSGSASVVDARSLRVRAVFSGCPQAGDTVILPDSSRAFVACTGGAQVMVIGLAREHPRLPSESGDHLLDFLDVGPTPVHLALKPDGGEIFVSNSGGDTVSEIATSSSEVGGAYVIGEQPMGGVVSSDNSTLWVSNSAANTVGAYSIDDGQLVHTVRVGVGPGPLALSDDGFLLLALDQGSGDVSVLRTVSYTPKGEPITGSLFTVLAAGKHPNALAVMGFRLK
ncbi:MAG TPA: YncE family protein [Acidobacteriaceae bacterium]|nr:YncE family protein [Acidobacteriaceae bacterium]